MPRREMTLVVKDNFIIFRCSFVVASVNDRCRKCLIAICETDIHFSGQKWSPRMMTPTRLRMFHVSFNCGFASNVKRECEKHGSLLWFWWFVGTWFCVGCLPRLPAVVLSMPTVKWALKFIRNKQALFFKTGFAQDSSYTNKTEAVTNEDVA